MPKTETDALAREALDWFVRMRDETVTDEERRRFEAWLAADEANAAALKRAEALWQRFEVVAPEAKGRTRKPRIDRRKLLLGGLAIGAAGGSVGILLGRPDLFADYRTGIAERRVFVLSDGSRVELGSDSALSLDDSPLVRRVVLHRGEGFFDVAPDPQRPFSVAAGTGVVEALGTRFDVKLLDDGVTVAVEERAVTVRAAGYPQVTVEQGWQTIYGPAGPSGIVKADLAAVTAWRQDRIVFKDVPLSRVLDELERYRPGRIVLTDRAVGGIPVTASFDARRTENALRTLSTTLPIRVTHLTRYLTIVRPR